MIDQEECCGLCRWHVPSYESGDWCCMNDESEYYGCDTEYKDTCIDFEERRR